MVNNSTNINKTNNHISSKETLKSDGQQFHQYQQNEQWPLNTKNTMTYCFGNLDPGLYSKTCHTNINKTNNHFSSKESLNSDGQQFHQYQQNKQSPLT